MGQQKIRRIPHRASIGDDAPFPFITGRPEAGDVAEEHFTTIDDDWDVEERTLAQLDSRLRGPVPGGAGWTGGAG
ncbi:hypothetical protein [Streptomyces sp. MAI_2237]